MIKILYLQLVNFCQVLPTGWVRVQIRLPLWYILVIKYTRGVSTCNQFHKKLHVLISVCMLKFENQNFGRPLASVFKRNLQLFIKTWNNRLLWANAYFSVCSKKLASSCCRNQLVIILKWNRTNVFILKSIYDSNFN